MRSAIHHTAPAARGHVTAARIGLRRRPEATRTLSTITNVHAHTAASSAIVAPVDAAWSASRVSQVRSCSAAISPVSRESSQSMVVATAPTMLSSASPATNVTITRPEHLGARDQLDPCRFDPGSACDGPPDVSAPPLLRHRAPGRRRIDCDLDRLLDRRGCAPSEQLPRSRRGRSPRRPRPTAAPSLRRQRNSVLAASASSKPANRSVTIEAMPTIAITTGTHIHCASCTEYPPTWRTTPAR